MCKRCGQFVNLTRTGKDEKHECGTVYCKTCEEKVSQGTHRCYLKPMKLEEVTKEPKYLFFDIETYNDPVNGHVPNLIIWQATDGTEYRFPKDGESMKGDVTEEFCRRLFTEEHRGYTLIAHNFRPCDGHFILKYMLDNNLKPEVIKRGTKLLKN